MKMTMKVKILDKRFTARKYTKSKWSVTLDSGGEMTEIICRMQEAFGGGMPFYEHVVSDFDAKWFYHIKQSYNKPTLIMYLTTKEQVTFLGLLL